MYSFLTKNHTKYKYVPVITDELYYETHEEENIENTAFDTQVS